MRVARRRIALTVLFGFAFICNAQLLRKVWREWPAPLGSDKISLTDQNLGGLRPRLPARGTVGFISNPESEATKSGQSFFAAQYALAPLVLVQGTSQQWLVVDGGDEGWTPDCVKQGEFTCVEQGTRGVALYRRVQP